MLIRKIVFDRIPISKLTQVIKTYQTKRFHTTAILTVFRATSKMNENLKFRQDPIVTKLDSPEFKSIFTDNLHDLIDLFKKYNYELRIAGGAVRDLLLNKKPIDIDFATTATPDQMKAMFTQENIRMINSNGEKHGTITPRINDSESFEVTTLRLDVLTDGRHAEVAFTTDWQGDANRRDLTINSMFLSFDGSVYDYFYGYEDLMQRRIAFVGDPDVRIKEDYLRILRYFRFYGRIAEKADAHDQATLDAIKNNIAGLANMSGERIWGELKKILQGNFASELMVLLVQSGSAYYIGLPETADIEQFQTIYAYSANFKQLPHPIALLSAFLRNPDDARKLHSRLKLSAYERDLAIFLTQNRETMQGVNELLTYKRMCLNTLVSPNLMREFVLELLKATNKPVLYEELANWQIPAFPLSGNQLQSNGCPRGKTIGMCMKRLKDIWGSQNFQPNAEELLAHLPATIKEVKEINKIKKPKLE